MAVAFAIYSELGWIIAQNVQAEENAVLAQVDIPAIVPISNVFLVG